MPEPKTCFVICPIGEDGSEDRKRSDQVLKHVIEPVVREFGYVTLRADKISKPGGITRQIIERLLRDPLVIADLTNNNANVFYELAVRHAVRKPVILIRQVGQPIPFDVAQDRAIQLDHKDLDSVDDCKVKLADQIRSVEQDPSSVDNPISTAIKIGALSESENSSEKTNAQILAMLQDIRTGIFTPQPSAPRIRPAREVIAEVEFEDEIPRKGISEDREFASANILKAEVRSTGPKGGDWGHGSRHYFSLSDKGGTSWLVRIKDSQSKIRAFDQPESVELLLGGDTELETFVDSLEFATSVFKKASKTLRKG